MGDPAGIGPELTLKCLAKPSLRKLAQWRVFGDPRWLRRLPKGVLACPVAPRPWRQGKPSLASGAVALESVVAAARDVHEGRSAALVTAPISKEALRKAGSPHPGHTELLAELCGLKSQDVGMLLVGGGLRVFLVTRHLGLRSALQSLSARALDQALRVCVAGMRQDFGMAKPRIALAALNPHAGEAGAFGREEINLLQPWARRQAKRRDLHLSGPWPADTVFVQAVKGKHDVVLCLYHDQGLIPLKLLAFESGVNVTLGLPWPRVSPDHGTAFDIAGQGKAHTGSMMAALLLGVNLAKHRRAGR